jgi:hypothetical protein
MLRISSQSTEYILVAVTASVVVTGDPVALAFTAPGADPVSGDWLTGSWVNGKARILVGPGGAKTLTAGSWDLWVRVTDNPEIPVRRVDQITVY